MTPTQRIIITPLPRHAGKTGALDTWRNDLHPPTTSRRRSAWRKWLACACLVLLGAAGILTTLWYCW